jgi:hypothetical protein
MTAHDFASPSPLADSCLYNSMIYPLLVIPFSGIFWYQGEANSGNPTQYGACFPAMISQWRADFYSKTRGASDLYLPFVFVQVRSVFAILPCIFGACPSVASLL